MGENYPVITLLFPLVASLFVNLIGLWRPSWCRWIALGALGGALLGAIGTWIEVAHEGEVVCVLGGWAPPIGIVLLADPLNALVAFTITAVALLVGIYSCGLAEEEAPGKQAQFYCLYLLFVTGLLGMSLTGDAFNLFVLMEVSSLSGYALIAMGPSRRAALAAYKYIIVGTIGASFYLLGVGYLYLKTGTLNMVDLHLRLRELELADSRTILVAFILITVGIWIKMGLFPLHGWLPNAYTFASSTVACLVAPLMTKVMVYVMIRMTWDVFGRDYTFGTLSWNGPVVWLAVAAMVAGAVGALAQRDFRRMLCYLIVAEMGYMVGGVWLSNSVGLTGAIYHIMSDAFMTLCLFLSAGIIHKQTGSLKWSAVSGLYRTAPWTMAAFTLGALSMIGLPPTCGFFSKWYLIRGGMESGHWHFVVALILSSLVNAIVFFRIFEKAFFTQAIDPSSAAAPDSAVNRSVSWALGLPLAVASLSLLLIGLLNQPIVSFIQRSIGE